MDEKTIHEFDEVQTAVVRTIPGLLWALFSEFQKQGFTEIQAMELTKKYLEKF